MVLNKICFPNDYRSRKSSPLVLGTKELPSKINHCYLIDVSKGPNVQTFFKGMSINHMPSQNDNFLAINITCPYEKFHPFVKVIKEADR